MKKPIHVKISERRRTLGLTQEKLGGLLGVSAQAVSKWENAECLPDLTLIPALCEALHISADDLLEVAPQPADKGQARVCAHEVRIATPRGISLAIMGAEAVQAVQQADVSALRDLLADEDALRILRALSFTAIASEESLAQRCSLSPEAVRDALFRLLRHEMCQSTPDGYVLGANAYIVFAALAAAYLASPEGRADVTTITTSYAT